MTSLLPAILPHLEAHTLPGLEGVAEIFPCYERYSLCSMPASICRWLDIPQFGVPALDKVYHDPLSRPFQHVVFLVIDGLGFDWFMNYVEFSDGQLGAPIWLRLLPNSLLGALTSVSPSTTVSALSTFWTGQPPIAHGVLGYEMWLKEYGVIANMISLAPTTFTGEVGSLRRAGFVPETFLPVPTFGAHLKQHNVQAYSLQPAMLAHSQLSQMLLSQTIASPFRSISDMWVTLEQQLDACKDQRSYHYLYWAEIDTLSHHYGCNDRRIGLEFASFSLQMDRFLASQTQKQRGDTLFIITADHGHLDTPRSPHHDLKNHPKALDSLALQPTGENRLTFFNLRPRREEQFKAYLDFAWGEQFRTVTTAQAIQSGLFGSSASAYRRSFDRLGDVISVSQGDNHFWWANKDNHIRSRHGGLSRAEMLVPWMAFVL